jgi:glycosyltransferase involved in cell wall biosynthesis
MRIAQVAPLYESVPPKRYGGSQRIVAYLTEELVKQGHEVTLFASGDSVTGARLIAPCAEALRSARYYISPLTAHVLMLELVCKHLREFDLVHFHLNGFHFAYCRRADVPNITTFHVAPSLPDLASLLDEFKEMSLVSISRAQQQSLPWANWKANVYNGLPEHLYALHEERGKHLAFLGRIAPYKGVTEAIEIAKRFGMNLKLAGRADPNEPEHQYFLRAVKPLLDSSIEYMGEIGDVEKDEILGNAYALLFPINWAEPFGLVMVEAMACGTPVIAYNYGSVPEVIKEGTTGFIVNNVEEAVGALERVAHLSRVKCRQAFEERFTADRMCEEYVRIYEHLSAL